MDEKTAKTPIIAAVAAIAIATALSFYDDGSVRICPKDGECIQLTATDYAGLKSNLAEKVATNDALSWDEYLTLVAITDREIKHNGGLQLSGKVDDQSYRDAIISLLNQ